MTNNIAARYEPMPPGLDPVVDLERKVTDLTKCQKPDHEKVAAVYREIQKYVSSHPRAFQEMTHQMGRFVDVLENTAAQLDLDAAPGRRGVKRLRSNSQVQTRSQSQMSSGDIADKYRRWSALLTEQRLSAGGAIESSSSERRWHPSSFGIQPPAIADPVQDPCRPPLIGARLMTWTSNREDRPDSDLEEPMVHLDWAGRVPRYDGQDSSVSEWEQRILDEYKDSDGERGSENDFEGRPLYRT